MTLQIEAGQPSWKVCSKNTEAYVTQVGGMLGPVRFRFADRVIEPFSVAPWCDEGIEQEPLLQALRGDFFCMPFGKSDEPFLGESHPLHGEPAQGEWLFDNSSDSTLDIVFETRTRPSKVYKSVRIGDHVIYQRHLVLGLKGPMNFGTHVMLRFQSIGHLSLSSDKWIQSCPGSFERPSEGGYSSLKEGEVFHSLKDAPLAVGGTTDLTVYPSREGYEDLVQVAGDPSQSFAWSAVTFAEEGFVYFQLKDPRVLTGTLLWFSNGGRHYAPWSGRHRAVLGIEEVTSYFHFGLRGSIMPNPLQSMGTPTYRDFAPSDNLEVKTVLGVVECPSDFGRVVNIVTTSAGIVIVDESGARIERPLDTMFLGHR